MTDVAASHSSSRGHHPRKAVAKVTGKRSSTAVRRAPSAADDDGTQPISMDVDASFDEEDKQHEVVSPPTAKVARTEKKIAAPAHDPIESPDPEPLPVEEGAAPPLASSSSSSSSSAPQLPIRTESLASSASSSSPDDVITMAERKVQDDEKRKQVAEASAAFEEEVKHEEALEAEIEENSIVASDKWIDETPRVMANVARYLPNIIAKIGRIPVVRTPGYKSRNGVQINTLAFQDPLPQEGDFKERFWFLTPVMGLVHPKLGVFGNLALMPENHDYRYAKPMEVMVNGKPELHMEEIKYSVGTTNEDFHNRLLTNPHVDQLIHLCNMMLRWMAEYMARVNETPGAEEGTKILPETVRFAAMERAMAKFQERNKRIMTSKASVKRYLAVGGTLDKCEPGEIEDYMIPEPLPTRPSFEEIAEEYLPLANTPVKSWRNYTDPVTGKVTQFYKLFFNLKVFRHMTDSELKDISEGKARPIPAGTPPLVKSILEFARSKHYAHNEVKIIGPKKVPLTAHERMQRILPPKGVFAVLKVRPVFYFETPAGEKQPWGLRLEPVELRPFHVDKKLVATGGRQPSAIPEPLNSQLIWDELADAQAERAAMLAVEMPPPMPQIEYARDDAPEHQPVMP